MKRPVIGISCMAGRDEYGFEMMGVSQAYLRAIAAAGGTPLMLPVDDDRDALRGLYDLCDGILISGGEDVSPACYGEEPHERLGGVDRQRDDAEIALARWAHDEKKPLLGICRGAQLINVAFGGTLYQDIPSQVDTDLCHTLSFDRREWGLMAHTIRIAPDSRLAQALGVEEMSINSMHHQAVKDVAPGLRAVAWATDGVVEAIEGLGDGFVCAVQCHPEELQAAADTRWRAFFRAFAERCAEHRQASVVAI
ncbi:MAG: gamma-glutamyl-gamma-aminobutyrate hydrolase family protein [Chloroflexales bacterium]